MGPAGCFPSHRQVASNIFSWSSSAAGFGAGGGVAGAAATAGLAAPGAAAAGAGLTAVGAGAAAEDGLAAGGATGAAAGLAGIAAAGGGGGPALGVWAAAPPATLASAANTDAPITCRCFVLSCFMGDSTWARRYPEAENRPKQKTPRFSGELALAADGLTQRSDEGGHLGNWIAL